MARTTTAPVAEVEAALIDGAAAGRESAFDELFRRHADGSWRLALAITGDEDLARPAVADAFATTFTTLRAHGTGDGVHFPSLLAIATRNAAVAVLAGADVGVLDGDDRTVAAAFARLPEHWRVGLWLDAVEGSDTAAIAAVLGLDQGRTADLLVRARNRFEDTWIRDLDIPMGPTCGPAVARLVAPELTDTDAAALDRHLTLCDNCVRRDDRRADGLTLLSSIAVGPPVDQHDRARRAWAGVVALQDESARAENTAAQTPAARPEATASSIAPVDKTGFLSPTTEKVLAIVTAAAAVIGVAGAAWFGVGADSASDDRGAAALLDIAPTELAALPTPGAFDPSGFEEITLDLASPAAATFDDTAVPALGTGPAVLGEQATAPNDPVTAAVAPPGIGIDAPPVLADPVAAPPANETTPAESTPAEESAGDPAPSLRVSAPGPVPVALDLSNDPGLTVGPISIGSEPTPSDEPVAVGSSQNDAAQNVTSEASVAPSPAAPTPVAPAPSMAGATATTEVLG